MKNIFEVAVAIDLDELVDHISAHSAWLSTSHPDAYVLTADNRRLIAGRIGSAFARLRSRAAGFISFANYNPNLAEGNVAVTYCFKHPAEQLTADSLHQITVEALANHALDSFYSGLTTLFDTAARKALAQLLLTFTRDSNYDSYCALKK